MPGATPAAVFLFSLAMGWFAYGLGLGTITQPGPGFFPFWITAGLAVTTVLLFLAALRRAEAEGTAVAHAPLFPFAGLRRIVLVLAGTAGFGIGLTYLGFLGSTLLFLAFCWLVMDRQPLRRGSVLAAAAAVLSYLLFVRLLGVHFPPGLFGF